MPPVSNKLANLEAFSSMFSIANMVKPAKTKIVAPTMTVIFENDKMILIFPYDLTKSKVCANAIKKAAIDYKIPTDVDSMSVLSIDMDITPVMTSMSDSTIVATNLMESIVFARNLATYDAKSNNPATM
jgi:hypothetical protein